MAISRAIEPITENDDALRAALTEALLPALAQATGDLSLLLDDLRPAGGTLGVVQGCGYCGCVARTDRSKPWRQTR